MPTLRSGASSPAKSNDYGGSTRAAFLMEMDRVSHRTSDLYAALDKKAQNDAVATGVGMVLFWPALFLIDGDGPESQEYARLKGEYEALHKAAVEKKCAVGDLPPSPEEILEQKREKEKAEQEKEGSEGNVPDVLDT